MGARAASGNDEPSVGAAGDRRRFCPAARVTTSQRFGERVRGLRIAAGLTEGELGVTTNKKQPWRWVTRERGTAPGGAPRIFAHRNGHRSGPVARRTAVTWVSSCSGSGAQTVGNAWEREQEPPACGAHTARYVECPSSSRAPRIRPDPARRPSDAG